LTLSPKDDPACFEHGSRWVRGELFSWAESSLYDKARAFENHCNKGSCGFRSKNRAHQGACRGKPTADLQLPAYPAYPLSWNLLGILWNLFLLLYDLHLEVYYGDSRQLVVERLRGEGKHRIDYRHVIWSLVKKPWALARYRYREALFPTLLWRRAYEALSGKLPERQADLEYLRTLHPAGRGVLWHLLLHLLLQPSPLPHLLLPRPPPSPDDLPSPSP
jgi:hypothetical protein